MASQEAAVSKAGAEPREEPVEESEQQQQPKKELYPMVNWKYDLFLYGMGNLVNLFFREVVPRGSWRVPQTGPVLFVAAPHANQVWTFYYMISRCAKSEGKGKDIKLTMFCDSLSTPSSCNGRCDWTPTDESPS